MDSPAPLRSVIPLDCVAPLDFYGRLLTVTLVPVALSALILLVRACGRRGGEARKMAFSAFLGLTFMVFPSVSNTVIQTFRCRGFDDGTDDEYLVASLSFRCGTPTHELARAYAGVMVAMYPIGVPLMYFVLLWRKRERIKNGKERDDDAGIKHLGILCVAAPVGAVLLPPGFSHTSAPIIISPGGRCTIPSTGGSSCSSAAASWRSRRLPCSCAPAAPRSS